MITSLKAPYLARPRIEEKVQNLLKQYNYNSSIPIPIEDLIEIDLGINIIPVPNLQDRTEADAFTSGDLENIVIDEFIFTKREKRYRYSIAHELGHIILHSSFYKEAKKYYASIKDWKDVYLQIDEDQHKWLEWQAYTFAGLILVPRNHIKRIFEGRVDEDRPNFEKAKSDRIPRESYVDYFIDQQCMELSTIFNVSKEVIAKRIDADNLKKLIP